MTLKTARGKPRISRVIPRLLSRVVAKLLHTGQGRVVTNPHWEPAVVTTEFQAVILSHVSVCFAPRLIQEDYLFGHYYDCLLVMAVVTIQFPSELSKRTGKKGKSLLNKLAAACDHSR